MENLDNFVYFDKRPGKGKMVNVRTLCEQNNFPFNTVRRCSIYDFSITLVGNIYLVYERDLTEAYQRYLEDKQKENERKRMDARARANQREQEIRSFRSGFMGSEDKKGGSP